MYLIGRRLYLGEAKTKTKTKRERGKRKCRTLVRRFTRGEEAK